MPEIQKPSNLNLIWADAGDKIKPDDSKIHTGWLVEIPTRQNFNWLDGRQDQFNAHVNQRGIAEYDPTTEYIGGKSYLQGSNGVVYFCYNTNITGVDPVSDTNNTYFREAFVTPDGYSGGKRFVGFEVFSTNLTAVPNHRYLALGPATVTLPTALAGDAVVIATGTDIAITVVDSESNTYSLNGKEEHVFTRTNTGWIQLDSTNTGSGSVSLDGPTTVTQGSTNSYTITDFNVFSIYTTSSSVGTFTRTGNTISLVVPNPANTTQITLTVTRDGNAETFLVAVGAQSVATPSILYPAEAQTSVEVAPTLTGSVFATVPAGQDTHLSSQWQISTDLGFITVVFDSGTSTTNKTSVSVPAGTLSLNTTYYARVKYTGAIIGASAWSSTRTFTTANQSVNTPTVSVTGGPTSVGETPTISTSAFSVTSGTDTHVSTDWQVVKVSDGSVVWQSLGNTTNKTSIVVPAALLQVSTQYKARARHSGASLGSSGWGEYTFTTLSEFFVFGPSSAGLPYGGGFYAGANIVVAGVQYAIIVAPKTQGGEVFFTKWALSNGISVGSAVTTNDGLFNTNWLYGQNPSLYPAVTWVKGLNINGYTDWYLPALDELEPCYRYLKPTTVTNVGGNLGGGNTSTVPQTGQYTLTNPVRTSVAAFIDGGSEAFSPTQYYWASTQYAGGQAYMQLFYNGEQTHDNMANTHAVRAIRRVPIPV